jgi:hypothetical protein
VKSAMFSFGKSLPSLTKDGMIPKSLPWLTLPDSKFNSMLTIRTQALCRVLLACSILSFLFMVLRRQ